MEKQFLRIKLITPANFGAGTGTSTIDRPTQKDAYSGLPIIPDSALKGVIAGRLENVLLNTKRTEIFGSPDGSIGEDGKFLTQRIPSRIVFGDGILLCFPFPDLNGVIHWVFPLSNLMAICKLIGFDATTFNYIAEDDWTGKVTNSFNYPCFCLGNYDISALFILSGIDKRSRWIVAGDNIAKKMWDQVRVVFKQTKITDYGVAEGKSLRKIEYIPSRSIFISQINLSKEIPADIRLAGQYQAGSSENCGKGFIDICEVSQTKGQPEIQTINQEPEYIYEKCFIDTFGLVSKWTPELQKKIFTIACDFETRWKLQGLEKTAAFCLAKAKKGKTEEYKLFLIAVTNQLVWDDSFCIVKNWCQGHVVDRHLSKRLLWIKKHLEGLKDDNYEKNTATK